jgi:hypothetical protein
MNIEDQNIRMTTERVQKVLERLQKGEHVPLLLGFLEGTTVDVTMIGDDPAIANIMISVLKGLEQRGLATKVSNTFVAAGSHEIN